MHQRDAKGFCFRKADFWRSQKSASYSPRKKLLGDKLDSFSSLGKQYVG